MLWSSKFTSAVGNFRGKRCFNSNHLSKKIAEVIIPSKIYVQFTIFSTYFSTKFLFTDKRYHLYVLEKCLYMLQKVRSITYFRQFIHPFSSFCVAVEQALLSRRISSYRQNSMTSHLGNFYFVSFFYYLFICRRQ